MAFAPSPDESKYFTGYPGVSPGLMNVGSYQVSGRPFVTGSSVAAGEEIRIDFPAVTKQITLLPFAAGTNYVTFAATGSNVNVIAFGHYIQTPSAIVPAVTIDVMCDHIYVSAPVGLGGGIFSLYASLTGINTQEMYPLTGSGIDDEGGLP